MNSFMGTERSNDERWEIIEDYFLGRDDLVDERLNINKKEIPKKESKSILKKNSSTANIEIIFNEGEKLSDYYNDWNEALELPNADILLNNSIPLATFISSTIKIGDTTIAARYTWMPQKICLMETKLTTEIEIILKDNGWYCLNADGFDVTELTKLIGE